MQVQLTFGSEWSDAIVGDDGKSIVSAGEAVHVYGLRTQPDGLDLLRLVPGCALPRCSVSGSEFTAALPNWTLQPDGTWVAAAGEAASEPAGDAAGEAYARPNILMFGDRHFNSAARADRQRQVYYEWHESLPSDVNLVILEVGVGTTIPKIRAMAECVAQEFERSTLIRINLDDMENVCNGTDEMGAERMISIPMGALAALSKIDRLMHA